MEPDKSKRTLRDLLDKVIQGRVDANRRSVDEVLERYRIRTAIALFRKAWLRSSAGKT
jgi:hypothetical protein